LLVDQQVHIHDFLPLNHGLLAVNLGIIFVSMPHAEEVCSFFVDKKMPGKSKDEQMAEKKQELEKRLLDVNDKIGNSKKAPKKGESHQEVGVAI
jgi:hypothetical protein